jgi:hypothetical protein
MFTNNLMENSVKHLKLIGLGTSCFIGLALIALYFLIIDIIKRDEELLVLKRESTQLSIKLLCLQNIQLKMELKIPYESYHQCD